MNKGFSLVELMIVLGVIVLLCSIAIPAISNLPDMEEVRKAQIISTDEKGNELWRVYDKETSRYIYYMPKGQTSWEGSGKGSHPMGVE